jgi:hypothetical protein
MPAPGQTSDRPKVEYAYSIAIQRLKKIDRLLKVVWHFFLRGVARIAARLERTNTSPVLAPLMLPETLIVAIEIDPVRIHIRQEIAFPIGLQNGSDIRVFPRRITVGVICAVTVIRPKTMYGP